jgi:hypothetical protein
MPSDKPDDRPSTDQLMQLSKRIDSALADCAVDKIKGLPAMEQAIHLAKGIELLRKSINRPVVEELFMPLQNTTLGFLTDKPAEGYPGAIVRDCVIEALVRGFQVVGNEFNIISGRAYFTREGFERRVREFPQLTELRHHPMIHMMAPDGKTALVPYRITYKIDGIPHTFEKKEEERIQVRVNAGMGPDAIIGKARRKALAALFDQLCGLPSSLAMTDGDVGDTIPTTAEPAPVPRGSSQQQQLDAVMGGRKPAGDEPPEPGSRG